MHSVGVCVVLLDACCLIVLRGERRPWWWGSLHVKLENRGTAGEGEDYSVHGFSGAPDHRPGKHRPKRPRRSCGERVLNATGAGGEEEAPPRTEHVF
ncbi:hypothetical protein AAFF_G00141350 [Aldrovandia affinis]|uniref:Secreted protein n=1 Tax=Aldrovandia affinis TaxID=143900 RepID=A0AAD7TCJ9_9TELE|nr:hypothetical protein AAFF_G00141350 [Aldrovandia affinis]